MVTMTNTIQYSQAIATLKESCSFTSEFDSISKKSLDEIYRFLEDKGYFWSESRCSWKFDIPF